MARSGWYNESYRHYLAAKGFRTVMRTGFFVGKGNLERGEVKRQLAKPLRGADGRILRDPLTGRPMYPTKAMLGIPYAPKPEVSDVNDPAVRARLQQEIVGLQQKYAMQQPAVMPIAPIVQEQIMPEPLPEVRRPLPEARPLAVTMQEAPEEELRPALPVDISDNVDAEKEAVQEYNAGAFGAAIAAGGRRVPPSELHVTPNVPPEPTSILQDTARMQP